LGISSANFSAASPVTFVLLQQQNTRIAAASFEHLAPRR
jgi:hypothetical protein